MRHTLSNMPDRRFARCQATVTGVVHPDQPASQRKALQALKSISPDWIVAEFFYGFGNNYAGAQHADHGIRSLNTTAGRLLIEHITLHERHPAARLDLGGVAHP